MGIHPGGYIRLSSHPERHPGGYYTLFYTQKRHPGGYYTLFYARIGTLVGIFSLFYARIGTLVGISSYICLPGYPGGCTSSHICLPSTLFVGRPSSRPARYCTRCTRDGVPSIAWVCGNVTFDRGFDGGWEGSRGPQEEGYSCV